MYENYLIHYGTLGMRWGRRKKPEEPRPKSKRLLRLEEHFKKKGLSNSDAEKAALHRRKTENLIIGLAGITLAAVGTYAAIKYGKDHVDTFIKEGKTIQNISDSSDKQLQEHFYASFKKSDNKMYRAQMGHFIQDKTRGLDIGGTRPVYEKQMKVTNAFKIAARDNSRVVLEETLKDSKAKDQLLNYFQDVHSKRLRSMSPNTVSSKALKDLQSGKISREVYESFNRNLTDHVDPRFKSVSSAFLDQMRKKGYSAIEDINDIKYSGFNAKKPLIVFSQGKNLATQTIKKYSELEIDELYKISNQKMDFDFNLKGGALLTGTLMSSIGLSTTVKQIVSHEKQISNLGKKES